MKMKLIASFAAACICLSVPVLAVDTVPALAVDNAASTAKPDLAAARAKIDAKDYAAAITLLSPMVANFQDADVYNLLGFSYRKSGDLKQAATFYGKALDFDPAFKPAIEYQGELFLQMNDLDKAKANLTKLAALCPSGCEERGDLEKAISDYKPGATTN